MTLTQIRRYALSLQGVTEEPHFDRTSFRVNRKIFVTARAQENHIHIFVPEQVREPALAMYPDDISKLLWGGKVVGLRVDLTAAQPDVVKGLLNAAWGCRVKGQKKATRSGGT